MPNKTANLGVGRVRDYIPVTTSDSTDNRTSSAFDVPVGFYVTGAGAVVFITDGNTRTISFAANTFVNCVGVTRIKATGTTATGIFSMVI